jgi:hypothetical protein
MMKRLNIATRVFLQMLAVSLGGWILSSCQPQTTSQKIENKAEDAAHEVKQATERARENVD